MLPNQGKVTNNICNMLVTSIRICFFLTFLQAFSHFSRGTFPCFLHFSRGTCSKHTLFLFVLKPKAVGCWRTGHGGPCSTLVCMANLSRTVASVPRPPASNVIYPPASNVIYPPAPQHNPSSILKNINKLWVAGGRGTETTVLL